MSDFIIWILLIFTIIIILGLYISEYSPVNLSNKEKIIHENFNPLVSSSTSQTEGASELYNWDVPNDAPAPAPETCQAPCPNKCPAPVQQTCTQAPVHATQVCGTCDITSNKDIDKYVLKSSVPACPDMSEYITKNMMNANPDLKDYILKSEVKPCEKMDISEYILKNEIPACPICPVCPECPICPVCPPEKKCKEIYNYSITDHPDYKNYISKDEVRNKYVLKHPYIEEEDNNIMNRHHKPKQQNQQNQQNQQKPTDQQTQKNPSNNKMNVENIINIINTEPDAYYAGDSLFATV